MRYKIVAHHEGEDGTISDVLTWADSGEELTHCYDAYISKGFSPDEIYITIEKEANMTIKVVSDASKVMKKRKTPKRLDPLALLGCASVACIFFSCLGAAIRSYIDGYYVLAGFNSVFAIINACVAVNILPFLGDK